MLPLAKGSGKIPSSTARCALLRAKVRKMPDGNVVQTPKDRVMTLAEKLEAIEEIKSLKARYCRFVDMRQWDALKNLFTSDARFEGNTVLMAEIPDRDAFVANGQHALIDCVSVHHVHCPEIEITSDTTASAVWAMEDMLEWNAAATGPLRLLHGMGHYHETYEKRGGRWQIASWKLTRLRVDT